MDREDQYGEEDDARAANPITIRGEEEKDQIDTGAKREN